LVADRLQHPGHLIQPIGRDEDEVAIELETTHTGTRAAASGATIALSIPVACTSWCTVAASGGESSRGSWRPYTVSSMSA
jgi:hypothetical protein